MYKIWEKNWWKKGERERGRANDYRPDRGVIGPIIGGSEETIWCVVFEFCVFSLSLCFI